MASARRGLWPHEAHKSIEPLPLANPLDYLGRRGETDKPVSGFGARAYAQALGWADFALIYNAVIAGVQPWSWAVLPLKTIPKTNPISN